MLGLLKNDGKRASHVVKHSQGNSTGDHAINPQVSSASNEAYKKLKQFLGRGASIDLFPNFLIVYAKMSYAVN